MDEWKDGRMKMASQGTLEIPDVPIFQPSKLPSFSP
jgi:hypothetical protein